MEIRMLEYFIAIAQEGSILAAANHLHITQPTLSRQLIQLEEDLGVTLIIRGKKGIQLTQEGKLLYKRAQEIVSLAQKTRKDVAALEEEIRGAIYIGAGETQAMADVAHVMKSFQKQYPKVTFHLHSGNGDTIKERLDKGLLDFGIVIEPINISEYHHFSLPKKDKWGMLMRKDDPLAKEETISASTLWHLPLILSNQSLVNKEMQAWLQKEEKDLHIVGTYNLIYNASLMVKEGMGYVIGLQGLIPTSSKELCFRLLQPTLEASLQLIWKRSQVLSKTAQVFLSHLQKELAHEDS